MKRRSTDRSEPSRRSGTGQQVCERRGTILVVLVVLVLVTMSIAGAVTRAMLLDARQLATDREVVQADRLAEAGLARAVARLAVDPGYSGEEWMTELGDGARGRVVISVAEEQGGQRVTAAALYPAEEGEGVRSRRSVVVANDGDAR